LIERAALKFAKWNHKALRLEAGVPTATDVRDWHSLEHLEAEGVTLGTYIVREPITAEQALDITATEFAHTVGNASEEEADTVYRYEKAAASYYTKASDAALSLAIKHTHEAGVQLLDALLAADNIFVSAMGDLEALGAAARVFKRRASQGDLDLALENGLIDWLIEVGLYQAVPSQKFVEWNRSYEVRPIGGVLPRLVPRLLRKVGEGYYEADDPGATAADEVIASEGFFVREARSNEGVW
jgi:hypothetical protein